MKTAIAIGGVDSDRKGGFKRSVEYAVQCEALGVDVVWSAELYPSVRRLIMAEEDIQDDVTENGAENFDTDRLYRLAEQKTRSGRRDLAETIADLFLEDGSVCFQGDPNIF